MGYAVKEIYFTLQGEGRHTGRPAVFCRFSGCNLWSGREEDRASAVCQFCDTEFVGTDGPGGGHFHTAEELARAARACWQTHAHDSSARCIVCTGGEPLLQMDDRLVDALHDHGFFIAVETNGTVVPPAGIDWLCVSPKAGVPLVVRTGQELKLIFPQPGAEPELFSDLAFEHFFLQPMDGEDRDLTTHRTVEYCLAHPHWRLSLQIHKYLGIP
jgi:7-carboxy-7-deazaguanine synthase